MDNKYKNLYNKYKNKYLKLKEQYGGANCLKYGFQQHTGECWHDALGMLLMQSDGLKDIFISQLHELNTGKLEVVHAKLVDLFSPENIDKNAYLLPFKAYLHYLYLKLNSAQIEINKFITNFLILTKEYIKNHIKRSLNRIKYDEELSRYPSKLFNYDIFNELADFDEQLKRTTNPTEIRQIKRRMSIHATNVCDNTISNIKALMNYTGMKINQYTIKKGGNTDSQLLAMEILNMYIIRSNPSYENMYIESFYLNTDFDISESDIYVGKCDLLLKLFNNNLIGIIVAGEITSNIKVVISPNMMMHAISLYKCDNVELLYDDNSDGPMHIPWYYSIHEYIKSRGSIDKLDLVNNVLNFTKYYVPKKFLVYDFLFVRKRMFAPNSSDVDREVKFILNKFNTLTNKNYIYFLAIRLFKITNTTIDNVHVTLGDYIKNVAESSLFDKNFYMNNVIPILKDYSANIVKN